MTYRSEAEAKRPFLIVLSIVGNSYITYYVSFMQRICKYFQMILNQDKSPLMFGG